MFPKKEKFIEIIEFLKELDLSKYPEREVYEALKSFQTFPIVSSHLSKGTFVTRVRPNESGQRFSDQTEVWHKPDKYKRASNPGINMFYGAIMPKQDKDKHIETERITSCLEASKLWPKETENIETEVITFSRWFTTRELKLVAIFDFEEVDHDNKIFNSIRNAYLELIDQNKDQSFYIRKFNKFMASEFSKYPIDEAYDYMISSIFTEMVVNQGFDGVVYPSTKTELKGYNIALNSSIVPNVLKLYAVCECRHYRLGRESIINNEMLTGEINDNGSFKLQKVDNPDYHLPEKKIIEELKRRN